VEGEAVVKRAGILLAVAAGFVAGGGWLLAVTWHLPYGRGLYCAIGTATTVGCDASPGSTAARVAAAAVMLTTIPVLAACFALVTGHHASKRIRGHLAGAEQRIAVEADRRHTIMTRHVERLLAGHAADLKEHVSAVAEAQASTATAEQSRAANSAAEIRDTQRKLRRPEGEQA
jgi:hypothetical protein